jgi:predicted permease
MVGLKTRTWLADVVQDLRFACRTLVKHPGFSAVAVATLALGIGANTAIFTLFNAILLRSLPVADPSRLVLFDDGVGEGTSSGDTPTGRWTLFSMEVYRDLRDQPLGFASLGAMRSGETPVLARMSAAGGSGQAERAQAHLVSGNYFDVLGVGAALGRTLTPSDDRAGAPPAAVLSDGFWRLKLNADPSIVGRTIVLNRTSFTIVGVTPREFFGERVRRPADLWVPLAFQPQIELTPSVLDQSDTYWLSLIGRLAPGVSLAQAQTASNTALRRFLTHAAGATPSADRQKEIRESRIELVPGATGVSNLRALYSEPLHVLIAVVGLVLLIACANVANLLLTRAAARRSEISMRIALGAGRSRLVRQLLTESLLLAGVGAACAVLLAAWIARALLLLVASPTTPVEASMDWTVLAFTVAIAICAGLLFGIAPALQASRTDLVTVMKARQGSGAAGGGRSRFAGTLVSVQIAVSLVLLVGASLFASTLAHVQREPLGFDADHVLLARVNPRLAGYPPAAALELYRRIYDRLAILPGVQSVTFARYSPLGGSRSVFGGVIEGYTPRPNEKVELEMVQVGPSYPETLGIPLLQGRSVGIHDVGEGPMVAMVNQTFVRRYLSSVNPIGRHFGVDSKPDVEIVGVLADAQFHNARAAIEPMAFIAQLQKANQFALDAEFAVRTVGDPALAVAAVRHAIAEVDPNLPLNDPQPLAAQVSRTFDADRLAAKLVGFFGLLALALAAIGLYGAIAQNVAQRTNEIGVRMALGAERSSVLAMILRQTGILLLAGLVLGGPAAAGAARLVSAQLFGVSPADPLSFGGAIVVLAAVALLAGYIPARRATKVDPVYALRAE